MITPYQGVLVDLSASAETAYLHERASKLNSIQLSPREICDLELLATGAFSPLDRFVGNVDLRSILGEMRLANGTFFPVPISLHIDREVGIGNEVDHEAVSFHLARRVLQVHLGDSYVACESELIEHPA